ncbi:sulfotransferase family 2 domain-containing protein [Shewanella japonica]|uniref:sulfotransferase family 2 domain-containing protein n=1 Tax=Shewanella japonica TaxID=93973 RepID=UPI0024942C19|nr:sulfotransferase family 2 domain-containing protein [Shewanella japonica]
MIFNFSANSFGPLKGNSAHQVAMKHGIMLYQQNALFTYIPKNACSTLRLSAAIANGCITSIEQGHWIHKNNQTFNPTLAEAVKVDYSFVVLRCPFRRLASVFLDKFVGKEGPVWAYRDLANREVNLDEMHFRKFVLSLKKASFLNLDDHWRPQSSFLLYKQYSDYFSMEQFSHLIETLEKKLMLNIVDARPLTKHGTDILDIVVDKDFSRIKVAKLYNLKRQGKVPSYESLYTPDLIEIVKSLYKADFDTYLKHFPESDLLFPYTTSIVSDK